MSRTTVQAGEKFQSLQEERIHTYRNLNNAHKEYLNTAPNYDFKSYQEEVAKATNKFNDLSTQIITLQKQIENNGASELSEYIKQVRSNHSPFPFTLINRSIPNCCQNQDY